MKPAFRIQRRETGMRKRRGTSEFGGRLCFPSKCFILMLSGTDVDWSSFSNIRCPLALQVEDVD